MKMNILQTTLCAFACLASQSAIASVAIDSVALNGDDSLNTLTIDSIVYTPGGVGVTTITGNISGFTGTPGDVAPLGTTSISSTITDTSLLTGATGSTDNGVYRYNWEDTITDFDTDYDFFVFEDGGNDSVEVQAVLGDGTLGVAISLDTWGDVSTSGVLAGGLTGRTVSGTAFHFTDLLDSSGANLTNGTAIQGFIVGDANAADFYLVASNVSAIPEPSVYALIVGLMGLVLAGVRRRPVSRG